MTVLSDNFNRANETLDVSSGNWSVDTGTSGSAAEGGWNIVSNTVVYNATTTRNDDWKARWIGGSLASSDYMVTVTASKVSDNDNAPGPGGRMAQGTGDANTDCYCILPYSDTIYLMSLTNSAETSLGTFGTTGTAASVLTLHCNGSRISACINGTCQIGVNSTTWASAMGVGMIFAAFGLNDNATLDNWSACDIGGGGGGAAVAPYGILQPMGIIW